MPRNKVLLFSLAYSISVYVAKSPAPHKLSGSVSCFLCRTLTDDGFIDRLSCKGRLMCEHVIGLPPPPSSSSQIEATFTYPRQPWSYWITKLLACTVINIMLNLGNKFRTTSEHILKWLKFACQRCYSPHLQQKTLSVLSLVFLLHSDHEKLDTGLSLHVSYKSIALLQTSRKSCYKYIVPLQSSRKSCYKYIVPLQTSRKPCMSLLNIHRKLSNEQTVFIICWYLLG